MAVWMAVWIKADWIAGVLDSGLHSGLDGYFNVLRIGIGRAIRSFVPWLVLVVQLSELMSERKRMINWQLVNRSTNQFALANIIRVKVFHFLGKI
jgi:hypothetical protein